MVMRSLFFFRLQHLPTFTSECFFPISLSTCLYVHSFVPYEHQGSWPELLYYQSIGVYSVGKVRKFVFLESNVFHGLALEISGI